MIRDPRISQTDRLFFAVLSCSIFVHVLSYVLGESFLSEWRFGHESVHSSLETAGALIAAWVGSGLGLSTCRKLLEKIGGSIDVKSSQSNVTIFSVKIPKSLGSTVEPHRLERAS